MPRRRLWLVVVLAASACTFTFDRALSPGEIRGTLVFESSSSTNLPAAGAKVVLENSGLVVQADTRGAFVISNLPPGTYALTITATDTSTNTPEGLRLQNIALTGDGSGLGNGRDLGQVVIGAYGSIAGAVTGPNEPVPSGTLVVSQGQTQVAVAQDAYQILNLVPGPYQLSVFAPGTMGAQIAGPVTVTVQPRSQATAPTFKLDAAPTVKTGSVSGAVLLAGTGSNAGVSVTLTGPTSVNVLTDATGSYSAQQVPAGVYTIFAQIGGFLAASVPDLVVGGSVTQVPLMTLAPATAGQGTTPDAGPSVNALFSAACQKLSTCGATQTTSESACEVQFQGIYSELTSTPGCAATAAALVTTATCTSTETCAEVLAPGDPTCQAQLTALDSAAQAGGVPCQAAIAPLMMQSQGADGGAPDGGINPAFAAQVHAACVHAASCNDLGTFTSEADCETQFTALESNLSGAAACTAAAPDLGPYLACTATAGCSPFFSLPDGGTSCSTTLEPLVEAIGAGGSVCSSYLSLALEPADAGSSLTIAIEAACENIVNCAGVGTSFGSEADCESNFETIATNLSDTPACAAAAQGVPAVFSCLASAPCSEFMDPDGGADAEPCAQQTNAVSAAAAQGGSVCTEILNSGDSSDAGTNEAAVINAVCQLNGTCGVLSEGTSVGDCENQLETIYSGLVTTSGCAAAASALLTLGSCTAAESCAERQDPMDMTCAGPQQALANDAAAGGVACQNLLAPLFGNGADGGSNPAGILNSVCVQEQGCGALSPFASLTDCENQFNSMYLGLTQASACAATATALLAAGTCVASETCTELQNPSDMTCATLRQAVSDDATAGGVACQQLIAPLTMAPDAGSLDGGAGTAQVTAACTQVATCGTFNLFEGGQFQTESECQQANQAIIGGLQAESSAGCLPLASALIGSVSCTASETCPELENPTDTTCAPAQSAVMTTYASSPSLCQELASSLIGAPDGGSPIGPPDAGGSLDGGPAVFPSQWATLNDRPGVRQDAPLLYDVHRNRLLTFGGEFGPGGQTLNDGALWALNVAVPAGQAGWQKLTPTGAAPVFDWQESAFADGTNDRIVIYSQSGVVFLQFDSSDLSLTQAGAWTPAMELNAPPFHAGASWAYCPEYSNAYLFGGLVPGSPPTAVNDLWIFPLLPTTSSITWSEFVGTSASGTPPPGLYSAAMTCVPGQGLVVYGGATRTVTTSPNFFDSPSLATYLMPMPGPFEWVLINDGMTGAPTGTASVQASLLVEPITGNVVLIGGTDVSNDTFLADTWSLTVNGAATDWTDWVSNSSGAFGSRAGAGVTVTPSGSVIYGFGGYNGVTPTNDLWELDVGTGAPSPTWVQDMPQTDEYVNAAAVYDSVDEQVVLFGGATGYTPASPGGELFVAPVSSPFSSPTDWRWFGQTSSPQSRTGAVAGYDPDFNQVWLFGGNGGLSDTWSLSLQNPNFSNAAWGSLADGGSPGARNGASGAFDSINENFIVFGGTPTDGSGNVTGPTLNDVWVLPGGPVGQPWEQWLQIVPSGTPPVAVKNAAATYDSLDQQMLIFGGEDDSGNAYNTVYSLSLPSCINGAPCDEGPTTWSVVSTTGVGPSPRLQASMAYDTQDRKLFVFGGAVPNGSGPLGDFYQLDMSQNPAVWTQLCPGGDTPVARAGANLLATPYGLWLYGGELNVNNVPAFPVDNAQYIIAAASIPSCN